MTVTTIVLTAEIGDVRAICQIGVDNLRWLPMDVHDHVEPDSIPHRILEIHIGSDRGSFVQRLYPPPPRPPQLRPWLAKLIKGWGYT